MIRVFRRSIKFLNYKFYRYHDKFIDTRKQYKEAVKLLRPLSISIGDLDLSKIDPIIAENLIDMWIEHRFDLLGSGWIKVCFENNAPGLNELRYDAITLGTDKNGDFLKKIMKKTNLNSSKEIFRQIKGIYTAIDWQKDYKSGYRWGADKWYLSHGNSKKPGGDIKVPWELARLQHFPRMAIFSQILPNRSEEIFNEFCNQCLDFIAQNPVRMGVNYVCTMDVGIRTANLALAYSLFKSQCFKFDENFEYIFSNFLFEQCNHIMKNLEWSEILTSNHYFANISGLLFGASVLPECKQKHKWLKFSIEQIKNEISKQFLDEGSNAEGSTAYHRLTGEMAVYSCALIEGLAIKGICSPIDEEIKSKLLGAGLFTKAVTRPDNIITQIGDNDSGMFFRLSPTGSTVKPSDAVKKYKNLCNYRPYEEDKIYIDENLNDCRTFVSAVGGLFGSTYFENEINTYPLEASLISVLSNGKVLKANVRNIPVRLENVTINLSYTNTYEISSNGIDLVKNIKQEIYAEFGLYIFKSDNLYLVVNGSDNGQKGNAGHAHNDKLSFELFIGGNPIFQDPGTFVYTALPDERNNFRSTKAHNTIYTGKEQNEYITLFAMKNNTKCKVSKLDNLQICVFVEYCDIIHERTFTIHKDGITILDRCNVPFKVQFDQKLMSTGYGKILN